MASVAAPRALDEDDLPLAAERPGGNPHGSEADGLNPGDLDPAIPGAYLAPSASHSRALHGSGAPRPFEGSTGRQAEQAEHAELTDRFAAFVAENGGTHDVSVAALEPAGSDPSAASLGPGRQAVAASAVTPATTPLQTAASGAGAAGAAVAAESRRWFSSPAPATTNEPARELITLRAPVDLAGWAVAVGGFLAALAFALPWAKNGVAGAGLDPSYFGQWGLANPAYLLLVVFALIAMLLALVPNQLPRQLVDVAIPFVLGGFLCGLGWSYATGPFGTGLGVDMMFGGAVLLVVGGSLGLRPKRMTMESGNSATTP